YSVLTAAHWGPILVETDGETVFSSRGVLPTAHPNSLQTVVRDKMQGTGVSVTRSGDNIILNMPNNVTFDSNSSNLKPAGANT
ncbi:hypothetical protein WMC73_24315, partial [Citrobacter braakii]